MLLYKLFQTIVTELLLASTPNPTWIEEKRPKSGFSTSIILRHYHWELLKLSILLKKKSSFKKYWKGPLLNIELLLFIELLELKRLTNIDRYFLMSHENWNCLNHCVCCVVYKRIQNKYVLYLLHYNTHFFKYYLFTTFSQNSVPISNWPNFQFFQTKCPKMFCKIGELFLCQFLS